MNFLRKIQYGQYWNIGFCEQTPEELIRDKQLKPIQWLKHLYRDRWFADPFILKVTEEEIVVFVEECPIENPKGIICELVIDRRTMRLKDRYVMLDLDTHLSYPAILWYEDKIFVYPENGASGKLNLYEYDPVNHRLVNPMCVLNEAIADATIVKKNDIYYMSATKFPNTQEQAFIYKAETPFGPFKQSKEKPYQTSLCYSRQGGNWILVNNKFYRPAQNCETRYGGGLSIMANDLSDDIHENIICQLMPHDKRYDLGLHTLNFYGDICVIDGYGYLLPVLGHVYYSLKSLLKKI